MCLHFAVVILEATAHNSHFLHSSSRQDESVRLLINNVINGGLTESSHDEDGVMAEVVKHV